jgi:hypothetical protein
MTLRNLYLLRIIELEVYISLLQFFLSRSFTTKGINMILSLQEEILEERKQLRRFLNIQELEKLSWQT